MIWNGKFALCLLVLLALLARTAPVARAQAVQKPVMENVFFNVVWGSAWGATMGLAAAVIGSPEKSKPTNVRVSVFNGATLGGVLGLGAGLYLVFQGITFDPEGSTLTQGLVGQFSPGTYRSGFMAELPPLVLNTEPGNPFRITGILARVVNLRF